MQNQKTCTHVTDLLRNNHRKPKLADEKKDGRFLALNAKRIWLRERHKPQKVENVNDNAKQRNKTRFSPHKNERTSHSK